MIKNFKFILIFAVLWMMQSCSVKTETTYYKDSATSMESNVLMDKSALGMMNMMNPGGNAPDLSKLSTNWKSLYDIQRESIINLNPDSVKVLKKLFMKLNKIDGEFAGISLKYDKLLPQEIQNLLTQSKYLRNMPLQDAGKWNGKTLTIDTEKFNMGEALSKLEETASEPRKTPVTKRDSIETYGRQMARGMVGMMKMFDMNITSTMKFQRPISSISGRHDFVKQIDKNTVQINVRTKDLFDENKKLKNKDRQIIITTE